MTWLTGDNPTADDFICRRLHIPNDESLIIAVSGALAALGEAQNWEQVGTLSPDDAAQLMLKMLNEFFSDDCSNTSEPITMNPISEYTWNTSEPIPANLSFVTAGSADFASNSISTSSSGAIDFRINDDFGIVFGAKLVLSDNLIASNNRLILYENNAVVDDNSVTPSNNSAQAFYPNTPTYTNGVRLAITAQNGMQVVEQIVIYHWLVP